MVRKVKPVASNQVKTSPGQKNIKSANQKFALHTQQNGNLIEALRLSEEKFRIIFEYAAEAILILDTKGKIIELNKGSLKLHKYDRKEELIGEYAIKLMAPESRDKAIQHFNRVLQGESGHNLEYIYLAKDGSRFIGEMSDSLLRDSDGNIIGIITITRDVTERKRTEEEIKLKAELLDNANDGIYVIDLNTFKHIYANQACLQMHGYTLEEFQELTWEQLVPPEYRNQNTQIKEKLEKGEEVIIESIHHRKDGSALPLEIRAKKFVIGNRPLLLCIARDITKRKELYRMIEEEVRRRRLFMERSRDGIVVLDQTGKVYEVNQRFADMLGYTMDEVKELYVWDWDKNVAKDQIIEMIRTVDERGDHFETKHTRKDGSTYDVEITTTATGANGQKLIYCVCRDISERKKLIAESQSREQKMRKLMDASPTGIMVTTYNPGDLESAKIEYINQAFTRLFGYKLNDIPDVKTWTVLADFQFFGQDVSEDWNTINCRGTVTKPLEASIRCRDGSRRYVTIAFSQIDEHQSIAIFNDISEIKKTEQEAKQLNERLTALVSRLEERERQNQTLSQMRDLLQVCTAISEISPIVNRAILELFPDTDGALFLMSPSKTDLESVTSWGEYPNDIEENVFQPDACWSLRRSQIHIVADAKTGLYCTHLKPQEVRVYTCVPLIAKGEILGMLHLRNKNNSTEEQNGKLLASFKESAQILSEYLSLSISNIKLRESLANQSIRDSLTGLYNRRYMDEAMQHEMMRADRKNYPISLMMMDIDHFKQFNDAHGHKAGDALLAQLAALLRRLVRGSDIICRFGGEEFVLILPESDIESTYKRAEELREAVKKMQVFYRDQMLPSVTISIGVAAYPINGKHIDELIQAADKALYQSKVNGRDRVSIAE